MAPRITTGTWKTRPIASSIGRGEPVELARLHEHVELARVEVDEEAHRGRQHDEVAEQHAGREQERDRRQQRHARRVSRSGSAPAG